MGASGSGAGSVGVRTLVFNPVGVGSAGAPGAAGGAVISGGAAGAGGGKPWNGFCVVAVAASRKLVSSTAGCEQRVRFCIMASSYSAWRKYALCWAAAAPRAVLRSLLLLSLWVVVRRRMSR